MPLQGKPKPFLLVSNIDVSVTPSLSTSPSLYSSSPLPHVVILIVFAFVFLLIRAWLLITHMSQMSKCLEVSEWVSGKVTNRPGQLKREHKMHPRKSLTDHLIFCQIVYNWKTNELQRNSLCFLVLKEPIFFVSFSAHSYHTIWLS